MRRGNMHERKRWMRRQNTAALLLLSIGMLLSGCGKKEIFVNHNAQYELVALSNQELLDDEYYIKEGADFYKAYKPEGTASGTVSKPSSARIIWLSSDESLIPSLYKNELIAFPSKKTTLTKISLERFKDDGYSFGLYGGQMDEEGYICYSIGKNCIKDTDAYEKLSISKSDSVRIVSINDEPVSKEDLNEAGIITGLEQGAQYEIGLYAGTYYGTVTLTADRHYMESYEVIGVDQAYNTKNGYLAVYMPDELPSGYYMINGYGLYKYYNYKKGEHEDSEVDMNAAYYASETESMAAYSQQYVATVNTKTQNVRFSVSYATDHYQDRDVTAVLISPDGTQYGMTSEDGEAFVEISEVMAGRWNIIIMPQDLEILGVQTESTSNSADAIPETKTYVIEEDDSNVQFYSSFEGTGDIWGTIENQNGESRVLDVDMKNQILTTTYTYLPAGTYTVTVYHYTDTVIKEIGYRADEKNLDEEIITITE